MIRIIFALILALMLIVPAASAEDTEFDWDLAGQIAVQHGGRVKPLDTFARDLVKMIYGKEQFMGQHPVETYFHWMADGERWSVEPIVYMGKTTLRAEIGEQEHDGHYFTPEELRGNFKLLEIFREGHEADQAGEKLSFTQTQAGELISRISTLMSVFSHEMPLFVPTGDGNPLNTWKSMPQVLTDSEADLSGDSPGASHENDTEVSLSLAFAGMYHSVGDQRPDIFNTSATVFFETQAAMLQGYPIVLDKLHWETRLNAWQPFFWAKILLVLAFLLYLFSWRPSLSYLKRPALLAMIAGFLFFTLGLALRAHIGGRAPWSNMYESLLAIGWSVVLIALIFELVKRERIFGMTGSLAGALTLGIAAYASLDRGINPLVPALQSYWLNYHVLTILASYACFALAMIIGHAVLIGAIRSRGEHTPSLRRLSWANLKIIQVGSATLILGILLGAVWANVSWGRFWGWDPKETWSLITWFVYIAFLHGRSAGWLTWRGLAVVSVGAFPVVVMTYYGVNYYLSGLHSYGAGSSPGIPWEAWAYLIFEGLFLTWAISSLNGMSPKKPRKDSPAANAALPRQPELEEA